MWFVLKSDLPSKFLKDGWVGTVVGGEGAWNGNGIKGYTPQSPISQEAPQSSHDLHSLGLPQTEGVPGRWDFLF